MRVKVSGAALAVAAVIAATVVSPAGAKPADVRIVAGPAAASTGYATVQAVIRRGQPAVFANLDVAAHDVVSASGLFRSALIGLGKTAPVVGTERLAVGVYPFFCSLHTNMRGKLRVIK